MPVVNSVIFDVQVTKTEYGARAGTLLEHYSPLVVGIKQYPVTDNWERFQHVGVRNTEFFLITHIFAYGAKRETSGSVKLH